MAFLAFITLKLKNNESLKYLIPKDPNYVKKLQNLDIFDSLAFDFPFMTFVGLLYFF